MKSTPTPLGYHHGASVFRSRKSYQGAHRAVSLVFGWRGIFFPWPSTKQPVELPAVLIEIFIPPLPSRRVVEMWGRLVTWWFICSRSRGIGMKNWVSFSQLKTCHYRRLYGGFAIFFHHRAKIFRRTKAYLSSKPGIFFKMESEFYV